MSPNHRRAHFLFLLAFAIAERIGGGGGRSRHATNRRHAKRRRSVERSYPVGPTTAPTRQCSGSRQPLVAENMVLLDEGILLFPAWVAHGTRGRDRYGACVTNRARGVWFWSTAHANAPQIPVDYAGFLS